MKDLFPGAALGIAVGFLAGIVLHHVAHARVAIALGDRSVRLGGRASLSIKRHADVVGTYILIPVWTVVVLFEPYLPLFAWGKPQEMNPYAARSRRNVILIAAAGPVATLIVGIVAGVVRRSVLGETGSFFGGLAVAMIFLTVFEVLPIPGRDGGRILAQFLSPPARLRFTELAEYHVAFIVGIFVIPQILRFTNPLVGLGNLVCRAIADAPCGAFFF